ncbi:uncharacterized protein JCM6883_005885 [Sporobolomyces salmoneus]|uniref:uncharacterized protein n=1 Tax=Sporobolomyces salmoneus TaxID=183962 RepID=UPI00316D8DBF
MDELLQPRKKARTELDTPNTSNPLPPSSTSSNTASNRQIHSVVYAGYEIQAQFSAPYPWDELVKESRSNRTDDEKGKGSSNGAGARKSEGDRSRRASSSLTGKKKERKGATTTSRDRREGTGTSNLDDNDSLSSLASSSDEKAPPERKRPVKTVRKSRKNSAGSAAPDDSIASSLVGGGIASFSTFPPPPPSPPLPLENLEAEEGDIPPPPPAPSVLPSTTTDSDSNLPKREPTEQVFQAMMAQDPRILSRESSPNPTPPSATATQSDSLPNEIAPVQPSPSGSGSSKSSPKRTKGGRFLPKPAGTTVKAQRALARQALAATASPSEPKVLTQRQQREIKRKEREAKEKEERERKEREGVGKDDERRLWVCERCFKYMADLQGWKAHQKDCNVDQPPGRRVYQRGATSIWEVDGATAKLYCQNLCLFAKLFIEHKYMFFDVEGFSFYLLTESLGKQEWVLGYFSKEKVSYDDYNLACIVVFPPFRQKGWATLLIEFSYELSRRLSATPGTPERPLSDLGQAGYLSHWTSVLVRYFRSIFENHLEPPYIEDVIEHARALELEAGEAEDGSQSPPSRRHRKIKQAKGWVGELPSGAGVAILGQYEAFTLRLTRDGEVDGRVDEEGEFDFGPSELEILAEKVNLQVEDVAWALVESGLAQWRSGGLVEEGGGEEMVVITPELVEAVAEKKKVKRRPMLDVAFMCL